MSIRRTVILSLGGSIIIPDSVNVVFLQQLVRLIRQFTSRGVRFVIVTGGGNVCREYQQAAKRVTPKIRPTELDWIGIASTKLNAELIRALFGSDAYHEVLQNPTKRVVTDKKVLVGAGWKPGFSSDKDAVMLAQAYEADTVINLSNISHVYTTDPKKHPDAEPILKMSWNEFLKMIGSKHVPGRHVPFDPEASKLAKQLGLRVVVCLGTDIPNLRKVLSGKKFQGTVIG